MIKLWLLPDDAARPIPIAYNKEVELQTSADTSPQHIFFTLDLIPSILLMKEIGWKEAEIARWFNMRVTLLRAMIHREREKRAASVP